MQTGNKTINQKFRDLDKKSFDGLNAKCALLYASGKTALNPDMYIRGSFANTNLDYSLYYAAQRAVSKYPQCYPFDITFVAGANTTMLAYLIAENGTVTTSSASYSNSNIRIPKNTRFYLCIEKNSADTVENICKGVTVSIPQDEINGLPAYYFADGYITDKISAILGKSPLNGLQFVFLTDVHCEANSGKSPALINYISKNTNAAPFIIFGGDVMLPTVADDDDILAGARIWQSWMTDMGKTKVYQVQGNHDYLGYYYDGDTRETYNAPLGLCRQLIIGNLEVSNISNPAGKLYYYFDVPTANTRIIVLNDYDTDRNDGVFYGYNGMSTEQIRWIIDDALNITNKNVLFISHQTYDPDMEGDNQTAFAKAQELFAAIVNADTFTIGGYSKSFADTGINFIAHLCGHMHADASNTDDNGVLTIQSTCDAIMTGVTGRTDGTITEQAFDVVSIDFTAEKLYMTRIGGGEDRTFNI